MVELIQELLLSHNCVIIPGFGAFIGNYHPAELRLYENKIYPPNKDIAFNRMLVVNDGLLTNAVANHYALSYNDAEEKVMAFSRECSTTLAQNKSILFKDIGKLFLDENQHTQFQPFFTKNYLLESFALESLPIQPVQRLKDAEMAIQENYQRIMHPEKMGDAVHPRKKTYVSYWLTAVLAVTFLVSSLGWNIHKSNQYQSHSSMLPAITEVPQQPVEQNKEAAIINPEMSDAEALQNALPEQQAANAVAATQPVQEQVSIVAESLVLNTSKTYVVVGAFFDEIHARKMKDQAESKGYRAVISTDYNNQIYRVSVELDNEQVQLSLPKIKA
ncbi:MAG: hypothetical protein U0T77_10165 [Chitinophagales bacterium]